MRKGTLSLLVVASLGAAGAARAEGAAGVREHDGVFLHLEVGFGALASKTSGAAVDVELSGGGSQLSFALGGAITRHLVLAGQLWLASVSSPEVKLNGDSQGRIPDSTLGLAALGFNVTYYLPREFYLSATPSIGTLSAKQGGRKLESKTGVAVRLGAGKEWWVSDDWAIGLGLQLAIAVNEAEGTNPPTWGSAVAGLGFVATYN